MWYGDTNNWQWVNLDYFDLVAIEVPAEGRHEAEHSDSYTQGGAKNPPNVVINEMVIGIKSFREVDMLAT